MENDLDLSDYIEDPDMDSLSYAVSVTDPSLLSLTVEGDLLSGEPLGRGRTVVSIIASDGKGGEVGTSFGAITVRIDSRSTITSKTPDDLSSNLNLDMFNSPNPFKNETKIHYNLEKEGNVRLEVFSYDGKLIDTLISENQEAGEHEILFKRKTIRAGVYFYKIYIEGQTIVQKMIIE